MDIDSIILMLSALLTSILSGTIGMGGGILLLAVMAQYYPLQILIPLHGLIQLGSNSSRVVYSFKHLDQKIALQFALGALVGVAVGSQMVVQIPEHWYKIGLGVFILVITFVSLPKARKKFRFKWPVVGAGAAFLGLFVGATGPLIAPFYLSENLRKERLVATKAACQMFMHLLKVIAFLLMGFVIGSHLPILISMLVMVFIGNYIGKLLLHRIPENVFLWIFKSLIIILCLRMVIQGLFLLKEV